MLLRLLSEDTMLCAELQLNNCAHLDDTALYCLLGLTGLASLSLAGCVRVTDIGLSLLGSKLPGLRLLDFSGCYEVRADALDGVGLDSPGCKIQSTWSNVGASLNLCCLTALISTSVHLLQRLIQLTLSCAARDGHGRGGFDAAEAAHSPAPRLLSSPHGRRRPAHQPQPQGASFRCRASLNNQRFLQLAHPTPCLRTVSSVAL